MIKLIASDMDGTLLDEKGDLNPEFFNILKELKEKNIKFAVSSGRQYYNLLNKFSKAKEDIIYIAENGTYIVQEGKELYSNLLPKETVLSLIEDSRKLEQCEIVLCGKHSAYVEKDYAEFIKEVETYYYKYEVVEDLTKVEDDILKFTLCDFKGAAENSDKVLGPLWSEKLQVTVSGKIWLDIINKGANKGVAIKNLQDRFNISFEETMVFGDYFNDLEMLTSAFHSYAMENAPEEVKNYARFIAPSNSEQGVLKVIKEKILL